MSQINPSGLRAFVAGETLEAYRRVKHHTTAGQVVYADADDPWIGTTEFGVTSGAPVTVKLRSVVGTRKMISASSAAAGARAYGAVDGKVDDVTTGGPGIGTYLDAPGAAGIACEILLDEESDKGGLLAAAIATSTAVTASAAATTFSNGSKTIDGADLKAGDILRIKAAGIIGTATGTETVTVQILVGTEVVATTGAVDPTSADIFRLDVDVAVRVAGAAGKLQAHGTTALGTGGTVTAKAFCSGELSEDISSAALAITCKVTNSSTGESVTLEAFTVETLRQ